MTTEETNDTTLSEETDAILTNEEITEDMVDTESIQALDRVIESRLAELDKVLKGIDDGSVTELAFLVRGVDNMKDMLSGIREDIISGETDIAYRANSTRFAGRKAVTEGFLIVTSTYKG